MTSEILPTLPIEVQVEEAYFDRLASTGEFASHLVREVQAILDTLGIPGHLDVKITPLTVHLAGNRFMRLLVNNEACRYSNSILANVFSYTTGQVLDGSRAMNDWVGANEDSALTVSFFVLLCVEAIKTQPEILLTSAHAEAYLAQNSRLLDLSSSKWEAEKVLVILRTVLGMRIALRDAEAVSAVLKEGASKGEQAIIELLIGRVKPSVMEILMPSPYLQQLTQEQSANWETMVTFLRDGMLSELGMWYPRIEIIPSDTLKPNSFAFRINHLTTMPRVGLTSEQLMVNDSVANLGTRGFTAAPFINPTTRQSNAVVPIAQRAQIEALGYTTWDSAGYVILCLASELRLYSHCLIDLDMVQDQIDELNAQVPKLVALTQAKQMDVLTVARSMLAEGLSIRDLPGIHEALIDHELMQSGFTVQPLDWIGLPDFARIALKRQVGDTYARHTRTLVVYLLDNKIEERLRRYTPLTPDEIDELLTVIWDELDYLPLSAWMPALLTSLDIRSKLKRLLAREIPEMAVVAYEELLPMQNIQPVARIGA